MSNNTIKSSNHNVTALELYTLRMQEKIKFASDMKEELQATLERTIQDDMDFKYMTCNEDIPTRIPTDVAKGYVPMEVDMSETVDTKEEIITLLVMCAILPDSKVLGRDMFTRPTDRPSLKMQFDERVKELQLQVGKKDFPAVMQEIKEQYLDRLQVIFDREDDLFKNAEVDDLAIRFQKIEEEFLDEEHKAHVAVLSSSWNTADEAMKRHRRMAMRLALTDWSKRTGHNVTDKSFTDTDVEGMLDGDKECPVTIEEINKQDRMILQKNNATYFRRKLEEKALLLRDLSFKAEQMQMGNIPADWAFVSMVTRMANRTKMWCEKRPNAKAAKPYSVRAVNALYNEAIHTLVALGVFKQAFTKKEFNSNTGKYDGVECSFFLKRTAEDMVDVKSGQDWADELRNMYYEVDDGTGRTTVKNSGIGD